MDNSSGNTSSFDKPYLISPHLSHGTDGCQVVTPQGRKCGEVRTLQIIQEFRNMYETKMKQIDAEAGGDCVQAKINLQQEWIKDLTEQNDMLVRVVEELELEAADRVMMLEEKLQQTSKCACEVMESYNDYSHTLFENFQKMDHLRGDLHNLLELIRRAKYDGNWESNDLEFYSFDLNEILNEKNNRIDNNNIDVNDQREKLLKQKNMRIKELEEKLANLMRGAEIEESFQTKNLAQQYSELKKSMMDMREALTAEVANKHDAILSLRRDVQLLEEQCKKADQQTHFKDDIIKELRKEIKQLKQKKFPDEISRRIAELEEENRALKEGVEVAKRDLMALQNRADEYLQERDGYKLKHKESLDIIDTLRKENNVTRERLKILQEKDESVDSYQASLTSELESYERKHRDSLEKIEKLRLELDTTMADHKILEEQILTLTNENCCQTQQIKILQAQAGIKREQIITNSVSVTASVPCKDCACNTSPLMEDKQISHMPGTKIIATSMDFLDSQIIPMTSCVAVRAEPEMLCQKTSLNALDLMAVIPEKKTKQTMSLYGVDKGCSTDCYPDGNVLGVEEEMPKSKIIMAETRSFYGVDKGCSTDCYPDGNVLGVEEEMPRSKIIMAETRSFYGVDKGCSTDCYPDGNLLGVEEMSKSKNIMAETRSFYGVDKGCSTDCYPNGNVLQVQTMSKNKAKAEETRSPYTVDKGCSTDCYPDGNILGVQTMSKTEESGSFYGVDTGYSTYGYPDSSVLEVQKMPKNKAKRKNPKTVEGVTIYDASDLIPKEKVLETMNYDVENLPECKRKNRTVDYLDLMDSQRCRTVKVDSKNVLRLREVDSVQEIEHAIGVEVLNQAGKSSTKNYDFYTIEKPTGNFGDESFYSPKHPTGFQPMSWDCTTSNSESNASSTTKYKPALKQNQSRSRSPSSVTDDLQSVVNDLSESVSHMMMKTPNEKASRQRINQLEEQLRAVNTKLKVIRNKDEMIKIQNETLNIIQIELQALKQKEHEVEAERKRRSQEVENLKLTIKEMEKALYTTREKSQNLQKAVDLNINTVNLLETNEENLKIEVAQQRMTIINLQDALVTTKNQLEKLQQKFSQEVSAGWTARWFGNADSKTTGVPNKNVHEV